MVKHMKTAWLQFFAVILLLLAPAVIATRVYADPPEIRVISVTDLGEVHDGIDWSYYEQEQVLELMQKRRPREDPAVLHEYQRIIWEAAERHGLRPTLAAKVVDEESRFNPRAISRCGARGMMQIMPQYHKLRNYEDPQENIDYGCRYLRAQLDRFQDEALALAAYNAGPGAVRKYKGVPPYEETKAYVRRVLAGEKKLRGAIL